MGVTDTARALMAEVLQRRGRRVFDLPDSGEISAGQINEELGRDFVSPFSIDGAEERALAGVASGEISFSDFHGKSTGTNDLLVGSNVANNIFGFSQAGGYGGITPITTITPYGTRTIILLQADVSNSYFDINTSDPDLLVGLDLLTVTIGYDGTNTPAMTYDSFLLNLWSIPDGPFFTYLQGVETETVPVNIQWSAPVIIEDIDSSNSMNPGNNTLEAGYSLAVFGTIGNANITWNGVALLIVNLSMQLSNNQTTLQMGNTGGGFVSGTIVFTLAGTNEAFIFQVGPTSDTTISANGFGSQELFNFLIARDGVFTNMAIFSVVDGDPIVDDSVGQPNSFDALTGLPNATVTSVFTNNSGNFTAIGTNLTSNVYVSNNNIAFSLSTTPVHNGFPVPSIYGEEGGGTVTASAVPTSSIQEHIQRTTNGGTNWPTISFTGGIIGLAWKGASTANGLIAMLVAGNNFDGGNNAGNTFNSINSGFSYSVAGSYPVGDSGFCVGVAMARSNGAIRYISTQGNENGGTIFVSTNSGASWTEASPPPSTITGENIFDIDCTHDGAIAYAVGSNGRLWRSSNTGASWQELTTPIPNGTSIRSVAVSSDGKMIACGVNGGGYYRSFDFGSNFTYTLNLNGLSDHLTVAYIADDDQTLYMCGQNGAGLVSRL